MKNKKKLIALLAGILVFVIVYFAPLQGLSREGQTCLAITLMTVVFWATQVASVGYVSGIYLMLLYVFKLADLSLILNGMTSTVVFLMMSVYLISAAVKNSGLGDRVAYWFAEHVIKGWKSLIISIFGLQFILSLLIPHPFPRSFLIMAVMSVIIRSCNISKKDAVTIGFTVFASSVPVSLIFITSDATISPLAASFASAPISFLQWFVYYGVPSIVLSILTLLLVLFLFKNSEPIKVNLEEIRAKKALLGKLSAKEIRCLIWVCVCVIFWVTSSKTGFSIGHFTFLLAMLMSLPGIGEVIDDKTWHAIPLQVAIFITAAIAIGAVGGATGMNAWIAKTIIPASLPNNIVLLTLVIAVLTIVLHMFMGSVIAVLGVAMPVFLPVAQQVGIPDVVMIGIVYLCCAGHYLLPFHHLTLVVGQGEENGGFSQKETLKMGLPLTLAVIATVLFAVGYWKVIGLF